MPGHKKKNIKTKRKKFDSFSEKSLKKYIGIIKKMRKKKVGKKKKKVGITNVTSMLNLLYNVDRERKKKRRQNLMKVHPYGYPHLIKDKDVNHIWSGTRVNYGTKRQMMGNLNNAIRNLYGFELLQPRGKKLPVGQRGPITMQRPQPPSSPPKPTVRGSETRPVSLPTKPSSAPPIHYDNDSDSDSSSSSNSRKKKNY